MLLPMTFRLGACLMSILLSAFLLSGCQEGPRLDRLSRSARFEPSSIDFGDVRVNLSKKIRVALRNTGQAQFRLDDFEVPEEFTLVALKQSIETLELPPGAVIEINVIFEPKVLGDAGGRVVVSAQEESAQLSVRGVGAMTSAVELAVPPVVDFGATVLGTSAQRLLVIENRGIENEMIQVVRRASDQNPATDQGVFQWDETLPLEIPAGGFVFANLSFNPSQARSYSDGLTIEVPRLMEPLTVALTGVGQNRPGSLSCEPLSIDFGSVERGLTLSRSVECMVRGSAVRVLRVVSNNLPNFPIRTAPSDQVVQPGETFTVDLAFAPEGLLGSRRGEIEIQFETGGESSVVRIPVFGRVALPSPPATAIRVELRWDTMATDVDVHLTSQGSRPVTWSNLTGEERDCGYQDLAPNGEPDDWGVLGTPVDDCFLDVDKRDGLGPELINLTSAVQDDYNVYVYYFGGRPQTTSQVALFLEGQIVGTFASRPMDCGELWHVGTIDWDGDSGTFQAVNTYTRDTDGPCR